MKKVFITSVPGLLLLDIGKQYSPRFDAASGTIMFAQRNFIVREMKQILDHSYMALIICLSTETNK